MARKLTTEEFIEKAEKVHRGLYKYSEVAYTKSASKVTIVCNVHGAFQQQAGAHLKGQGCPRCSGRDNYKLKNYMKLVKLRHKSKFTYYITEDLNPSTIIDINCKVHGTFKQRASSHLEGVGCKKCAHEDKATSYIEYCDKAAIAHKGKYSYVEELFNKTSRIVTVVCPKHGRFKQDKSNHLQGHGCPRCGIPGYDISKPGTLYFLEVTTPKGLLWKIGITNKTVDLRFSARDLQAIKVLYQHTFSDGEEASKLEKEILHIYKEFKYEGPAVLQSGNTELFTKNITINNIRKQHANKYIS